MYPSYNSTKVIHEARLREFGIDGYSQTAEQIIDAGLLARLRVWLAARTERSGSRSNVKPPARSSKSVEQTS